MDKIVKFRKSYWKESLSGKDYQYYIRCVSNGGRMKDIPHKIRRLYHRVMRRQLGERKEDGHYYYPEVGSDVCWPIEAIALKF